MSDEAVELELPLALPQAQCEWLVASRIPVRSLQFTGLSMRYTRTAPSGLTPAGALCTYFQYLAVDPDHKHAPARLVPPQTLI